jgi:lysophospholipase L1-like esterase
VDFHFNAQGCRHATDLAVPKSAGVTRILVLGDSFTEGAFNNLEDTAAARLQKALEQTNPGQRYEVVNCAFSAYSPILHYIRLRDQFLALQPDAVIVNVDNTDIFDDYWRYRPFATFRPDGEPELVHRPGAFARQVKEFAWYYSYLFRYLFFVADHGGAKPAFSLTVHAADLPPLAKPADTMAFFSSIDPASRDWKEPVDFCLLNVERIVKLLRGHGVKVAITGYPHARQLPHADGSAPEWNRAFEYALKERCASLNVPFFSAWDGIAAATQRAGSLYWADDMHFTPAGEQIWSDLIARWWISEFR